MIKKTKSIEKNIIVILFFCTIVFMSVGFALYNQTVNFGGTAVVHPDGKIYISNVTKGTMDGATANPEFSDMSIDFNLEFTTKKNTGEYSAQFFVTITNDSSYDFVFATPTVAHTITQKSNGNSISSDYIGTEISGIKIGDKIESGASKTVTVLVTFTTPDRNNSYTYVIDGEVTMAMQEDTNANIIGTVDSSAVGDLRGNNKSAAFSVNVINTYNVPRTFTLYTDESGVTIKGADGTGTPTYTIDANSEQEFQFCINKTDGADYPSSTKRVNVMLNPDGLEPKSVGRVSVLVDQTTFYDDRVPPVINNVLASINNTNGSVHVSWNGTDDVLIDHYVVVVFNKNGTEVKRITTTNDNTEINVTGLSAGSYYFVVAGVDNSGNTATEAQILSATNSQGAASKSVTLDCKWVFTITYNTSYISHTNNATTVNRGDTYTTSLSATGGTFNSQLPDSMGVTMDGETYNDYMYSKSNKTLEIRNITGDIVITGTANCLVEGTKILLANGKYKNIEDVQYTDLLTVYDHINGGTTKVYPIWIEKAGTTNSYEKITFSDGSELKVVNNHTVYSADLQKYVDVSNSDEFNIGSNIYKVENNELKIVSVVDIEYVHETVKFYNVVSTKYYNIIANGILTTDATSSISNIYGFKENAIYSKKYNIISNGLKLKYKYVDCIPYYLYKGLNLQNALLLVNNGMNVDFLNAYIKEHTLLPITKNGKFYFSISTSLDDVNSTNTENYLYEQGSVYTIPSTGANYFVETSTGKVYKPGESFEVTNSIYLEAF